MKLLENKIKTDGVVKAGDVLKVDGFLNHQVDVALLNQLGKEFKRLYSDCTVNKILTVEASGIGIACVTAQFFNCNVVFAKKSKSSNIADDVYSAPAYSFTHKNDYEMIVSKQFLSKEDKVLIIDDFLANGSALDALIEIVNKSGAQLVGCGIAVEKQYQGGGDKLRAQSIRVESLAKIKSMDVEKGIEFAE